MDDTMVLEGPPVAPPVGAAPVSAAPVGLAAIGTAAGGVAVLGAAVALGTGSLDSTLRLAGLLVGPAVGAVVLTTPALLVAHQFLAVGSPVTSLTEALARAAVRVGLIGWGFAPVSLLFSVTAPGLWPVVFVGDAVLIGLVGTAVAGHGLWSADRRHPWWAAAVVGWCALTLLVAARLVLYSLSAFA